MEYLTIDQAVEDYANFLHHLRTSNSTFADAPVIVVGGSYAALLSTLLRVKHPELVTGAISSAAPIFLYTSGIDGDLYFETVSNSFTHYYPALATAIITAFTNLNESMVSGDFVAIKSQLNLCDLPTALDTTTLAYEIKAILTNLMQYNYPARGWPVTIIANRTAAPGATWGTPLAQALAVACQLNNTCYSPAHCGGGSAAVHSFPHAPRVYLPTHFRT